MLDRISNREPPHDRAAERALLGAILLSASAMSACVRLKPADFFEPTHARTFEAMQALHEAGKPINLVTMRPAVQAIQPRSEGALAGYLTDLLGIGAISDVGAIAEQIIEMAARRRLCGIAEDLNAAARTLDYDIRAAAGLALDDMDEVLSATSARKDSREAIGDTFRNVLDNIGKDTGGNRVTTGLHSLDAVLGGWRRKQFNILAGRPSMGKTAVITSAMLRTARKGHGVLMFSLEMTREDLALRCLADIAYWGDAPIAYSDVSNNRISERDRSRLGAAAAHWATLPLVVDDQRGLTMVEIGARVRAERQRMEKDGGVLSLVIIDHLGLIKPSGRYAGNKVNEVGEISDGLATLAKENDVAVVALQQLNRGTEARENKRPTLADLRNSGDLEQDADVVCFAYRPAYYLERAKADEGSMSEQQRIEELDRCRNSLEILVSKNRNGPTTTVTLYCDMPSNVVRDLAR